MIKVWALAVPKGKAWATCPLEEQPKTNNGEKQRLSNMEKREVQWPLPKFILIKET